MSTAANRIQSEAVPGTSYTFEDLMHSPEDTQRDLTTRIAWASEDLKRRVATMLETRRGRNQLLIAAAALGFGVGILLGVWRSHG